MKLEQIRKKIDSIDGEILKLLSERMEFGLRAKKFKKTVQDKARKQEVLKRLKKHSSVLPLIASDFVERLFVEIINENRRLQEGKKGLIGFQGEHGAFGEVAARCYDPHLVTIPCPEFADVFEGVEEGYLDRGIVPVENSLGGAVTQVNEQLIETDLKLIAAIKLSVNHCLLALPGANYREIRPAKKECALNSFLGLLDSKEKNISPSAVFDHLIRPEASLDFPDVDLPQKEHAEPRLTDPAADGERQFASQ